MLPGFDAVPAAVPWNGYHSVICPGGCDGVPDGVECDCPCHTVS